MNPHNRMQWTLLISLLIWAPVAYGIIAGRIDIVIGGLYYVGALIFGWVGTGVIVNITQGYRRTIDDLERTKRQIERIETAAKHAAEQEQEREQERNRRKTDPK